jgi:HEPN domain-containing protein
VKERSGDWYRQAENDYSWAVDTVKAGKFAQACFICQQVAEKSLKAVAYRRGSDLVKSHSVLEIAKSLKINGEIETIGKRLDLYYISTRYPDAFPTGAPFEYYTREQADEALVFAKKILAFAAEALGEG